MKKFIIALVLSLFFTSTLFAQTQSEVPEVSEDLLAEEYFTSTRPDLYVDKIELYQSVLRTGNLIDGSFSIFNAGERNAADVRYKINLLTVTVEDNIIYPLKLLNSSEFFEVGNIPFGEKTINFSYRVPNQLPKNEQFAIGIDAYLGEHINAEEIFLIDTLEGNLIDFIDFENASLHIGQETFFLKEGPTVSPGEDLRLELSLIAGQAMENVIPKIKIFEGNDIAGNLIQDLSFDSINLSADNLLDKTYNLPTQMDSGVYTAVIEFYKDNLRVSEVLEMRYIINDGNLKTKIVSVDFNSFDQNNIDNFIVSVSFSEASVNYRKDENDNFIDPRANDLFIKNIDQLSDEELAGTINERDFVLPENLSTEISIFDAKTNKLIDSINLDSFSMTQDILFNPIKKTDEIKVVVDLKEDGNKIDTKEFFLYITPKQGGPIFNGMLEIVSILILLVIVCVISFVKKKNKISALSIILFGCVVAGSLFFTDSETYAGTVYLNETIVSNPKPPSVREYNPGEGMNFSVSLKWIYCTNAWANAHGRVSAPVPVNSSHSGFGGFTSLGRSNLGKWGHRGHFLYQSNYSTNFTAPSAPGVYKFRYEIKVSNGENTGATRSGEVVFKVKNPPPPPPNLQCSVSKNKLEPKEPVTYTAKTILGMRALFNWYRERDMIPSNLVKTENNTAVSTYTTSFNAPGIYFITTSAFANGQSRICRTVVSVGDKYKDISLEGNGLLEYLQSDEYLYYIDEDGKKYLIDRNAPVGDVNLDFESNLTNNTCKAEWSAENVLKCLLNKEGGQSKEVEFSGSEDLAPGAYQVLCIQAQDGNEIRSETRTCIQNPNFREM